MKILFFLSFIFLFGPRFVHAADFGDVVISEIAWMGSTNSYNDEWLELYNNTDTDISIEGWTLKATGDKSNRPNITLGGIIVSRSFFLLERTDDTSVPDIPANQIYTGLLGNDGEHLELIDLQGNLIDDVNSFGGWFAGDNADKYTMERKSPTIAGSNAASWASSQNPNGTPKEQNSAYETPISADNGPINDAPLIYSDNGPIDADAEASNNIATTTTFHQPEVIVPEPPLLNGEMVSGSYPSNVFINEIMPSPLGADESEEWIELINENSDSADISAWQLRDGLGAINIYTFPENSIMPPGGFLVLSRITTKITMNNDGDAIQLIRPDEELVQTVPYMEVFRGKSYARTNGIWQWSAIPTPGSANIAPVFSSEADGSGSSENEGSIDDAKGIIKDYYGASGAGTEIISDDTGESELSYISSEASGTLPSGSEQLLKNDKPEHLASVGKNIHTNLSSYITAFVAVLIAFFSAFLILIFKKRLK